jgi:hypothetical protein
MNNHPDMAEVECRLKKQGFPQGSCAAGVRRPARPGFSWGISECSFERMKNEHISLLM